MASEHYSLGFHAPAQSLPGGYHVILANCPCGTQEKKALQRRFWMLAFIERDSDLSELCWLRCLGCFLFLFPGTFPHIGLYVWGGFCQLDASNHLGEKMWYEIKAGHRHATNLIPQIDLNLFESEPGRNWVKLMNDPNCKQALPAASGKDDRVAHRKQSQNAAGCSV